MPEQAQITSVEAIAAFRANLIVFLAQARAALEEVGAELAHTRLWVEDDRDKFWMTELRRRERRLEEAKNELFSASMSKFQEATPMHHLAVRRAQQAVQEAEAKLGVLKKWNRELDNRSAPLMKQIEQLHGFLFTDMTRAIATLDQTLKTLDAYAATPGPAARPQPPAASGKSTPPEAKP
jgi:hypothetical protein